MTADATAASDTRADSISWGAARTVAGSLARPNRLTPDEWRALEDDFAELTPIAEDAVAALTGLTAGEGPAHAVVVDRVGWVSANTHSFDRLLTPLLSRFPVSPLASMPGYSVVHRAGRALTGAEVGALLGWMAGRVLGQYDVIFGAVSPEGDSTEAANSSGVPPVGDGDVLFVGPNIVDLERRYGFPPRQFRLWIALHELTHRVQFTGVPWMRSHFLSLIEEAVGSAMPDTGQLVDGLKRALQAARSRQNPLESDVGLLGLFLDPEQKESFERIQGLMSLLEGHGDIVMDRASADRIPLASHFSRVLAARRKSASGLSKVVMQLVGLDAKMRQYAEGENFVKSVEEAGGRKLFDRVWDDPGNLPDATEIREPQKWVERIRG